MQEGLFLVAYRKKMTHVDTQSVLKLLAAEYERSKQEQIERFLRDQEELNKKFSEFALTNDDRDNEVESDDSDTASVFTQRMSVFKSRPQTAVGWTEVNQSHDKRSDGSSNCNVDSETEEWKSAVASAGRAIQMGHVPSALKSGVPFQSNSRGAEQTLHDDKVSTNEDRRLLNRRTERPRTATGVRRKRFSESQNNGQETTNDEQARTNTRPMRSSAPAVVSRSKVSWENERSLFLPDSREQNGLIQRNKVQPSYATARSNTQSFSASKNTETTNKSRTSFATQKQTSLDSNNCMIISSINPSARDNRDGDVNARMARRRETSRERRLPSVERGDKLRVKQVAVLKLPPLSRDSSKNIPGSRQTPDYSQHGTSTQEKTMVQQKNEYRSMAR